jgi:hypothetical protein
MASCDLRRRARNIKGRQHLGRHKSDKRRKTGMVRLSRGSANGKRDLSKKALNAGIRAQKF